MGKRTAQENLSIGLHEEGIDRPIRGGGEGWVDYAIRSQPGNIIVDARTQQVKVALRSIFCYLRLDCEGIHGRGAK